MQVRGMRLPCHGVVWWVPFVLVTRSSPCDGLTETASRKMALYTCSSGWTFLHSCMLPGAEAPEFRGSTENESGSYRDGVREQQVYSREHEATLSLEVVL
jgi:hypothetical protein